MRKVFFSFDWDDVWRVNQVRNSWVAQGSYTAAGFVDAADIEGVKKAQDSAIKKWINDQLHGTSVTCVLIGSQTAESNWVNYEIQESIRRENGLLGVYIHSVKDSNGYISGQGRDPFGNPPMKFSPSSGTPHYPCCSYYDWVQNNGRNNLGNWIEHAARQAGR